MHVTVYQIFWLIAVDQINETGEASVCIIVCIAITGSGGVRQYDINASGFPDFQSQLSDSALHLSLAVLVWTTVVCRTSPESEDAKPLADDELIFDAVASLWW